MLGTEFYFPCNQWLDRDRGDRLVDRTLSVGEKPKDLVDEYQDDDDLNNKAVVEEEASNYPGK